VASLADIFTCQRRVEAGYGSLYQRIQQNCLGLAGASILQKQSRRIMALGVIAPPVLK
jgi:hypothetical protein